MFRGLELLLNAVVTQLATLTENHKAYPILHYFHSARTDRSPIIEIVVLDEVLTLLRFGIPERHRPNETVLRNSRTSIENYLETLHEGLVEPAEGAPPQPVLRVLCEAGIPTVSDDEFETALEELETRRRILYGLVESDAREWPSTGPTDPSDADGWLIPSDRYPPSRSILWRPKDDVWQPTIH